MKPILAISLLAFFAAAFVWERIIIGRLQAENEWFRVEKLEADRLAVENRELPNLRAAATASVGQGVGTELLRLRNEVRQLRGQQPELDRLRAQNERLAAEINSGITSPPKLSEMEGYLAKESWSNAGFDTPEATAQTFFWAIREGDLARMAECMPPNGQYLLRLMEQGNEQERERTLREFQGLTQGSGFRIVTRAEEQGMMTRAGQSIAEGTPVPMKVTLGLQAAVGGAVIPLQLTREHDGWKVKSFF